MVTGSPRNGSSSDNRVAQEAAPQYSDSLDRDESDALVANKGDDLTTKASSLAVSEGAAVVDNLTGQPAGASVMGAATPIVDVHAQIAQ